MQNGFQLILSFPQYNKFQCSQKLQLSPNQGRTNEIIPERPDTIKLSSNMFF